MTRDAIPQSPAAFRRSLNDRLRNIAQKSNWSLSELQRFVAYDRLLQRLYEFDNDWTIKGAVALLARQIGSRGSLDIDLFRHQSSEVAIADLRSAAGIDLGDWFQFDIGAPRRVIDEATVTRVSVKASIAGTPWVNFHVDVVGMDIRMTAVADDVPPLAPAASLFEQTRGYRAYPLVDHVADKVLATLQRYGPDRRPSSRYHDLVDLVAIVASNSLPADAQSEALRSEATRRSVELPMAFSVPDTQAWTSGYAAEARRAKLIEAPTLDEALAIVRPFLDPLLNGSARGAWDPGTKAWHEPA